MKGTSKKMLLLFSFKIPHAPGGEPLTGFPNQAYPQDSTDPGKGWDLGGLAKRSIYLRAFYNRN